MTRKWYRPRYIGPSINKAHLSLTITKEISARSVDQFNRCWDELCDANAGLETWIDNLNAVRSGTLVWKFVENDQLVRFRITRTRNVIATLSDAIALDPDNDLVIKGLIARTLTLSAGAEGVEPYPFT